MGQILHSSATTTEAVRRAIQHSQESLRALAKRYSVNPKTIAKWKHRTSAADVPTGPRNPSQPSLLSGKRPSSSLSPVALRRSKASHLTNSSAKAGKPSQNDSHSTCSTKCRDQTPGTILNEEPRNRCLLGRDLSPPQLWLDRQTLFEAGATLATRGKPHGAHVWESDGG